MFYGRRINRSDKQFCIRNLLNTFRIIFYVSVASNVFFPCVIVYGKISFYITTQTKTSNAELCLDHVINVLFWKLGVTNVMTISFVVFGRSCNMLQCMKFKRLSYELCGTVVFVMRPVYPPFSVHVWPAHCWNWHIKRQFLCTCTTHSYENAVHKSRKNGWLLIIPKKKCGRSCCPY